MMTAKAHGKNRIVLYDEESSERPDAPTHERDVRSIAHMKMLQSLSGKLNRLNDVREIGDEIAAELRSLIDYHNCRVFVVDGEELVPDRVPRRVRRRDGGAAARAAPHEDRHRHHGPLRRDGRVAAHPRRRELRVRLAHPGNAVDRGVAPRRAAALRRAGRRRDRRLEARSEPVRRGRRAAARGARRPRGRRGREREPLRVGAPGGRERDAAARVRARARLGVEPRRHPRAHRRVDRDADRLAAHLGLDRRRGGLARPAEAARRRRRGAGERRDAPLPRRDARKRSAPARAVRARPEQSRDSTTIRSTRTPRTRSRRSASAARLGCIVAALPGDATSASASSACSAASRTRRSSRSRTRATTKASSRRSSRRSRRLRTRSRRTTSTRRCTRAGSPTWRCASATSSSSTSAA